MMNSELPQAVIQLHEVRRLIEKELGTCKLSVEIERCAASLSTIITEMNKHDIQQN